MGARRRLDRRTERDALENLIPMLRGDLGWQGEEAQAFLDEWEHDAHRRLPGGRQKAARASARLRR